VCSHLSDPARMSEQQYVGAAPREQAAGHHASKLVDGGFELNWVGDFEMMRVEYDVAVIGGKSLPQQRLSHLAGR